MLKPRCSCSSLPASVSLSDAIVAQRSRHAIPNVLDRTKAPVYRRLGLQDSDGMPVVTDFPFTLDQDRILKRYGREISSLIDRPDLRQVYEAALAEARTLVRPGIAYTVHPVVLAEEGRLIIGEGPALERSG